MGGWARLPHTGWEVLAAPRGLIKCPGSDLVKSATRKKNKKQTIQYDETGGIQNTVDTYRVTGGIHENKKTMVGAAASGVEFLGSDERLPLVLCLPTDISEGSDFGVSFTSYTYTYVEMAACYLGGMYAPSRGRSALLFFGVGLCRFKADGRSCSTVLSLSTVY